MQIRLKVSVKARGGRIYIPGVYDLEKPGFETLATSLEGVEDSTIFELIQAPSVAGGPDLEEDRDELDEEQEDAEEEAEEEDEEEVVEKPKKKKKKKKVE